MIKKMILLTLCVMFVLSIGSVAFAAASCRVVGYYTTYLDSTDSLKINMETKATHQNVISAFYRSGVEYKTSAWIGIKNNTQVLLNSGASRTLTFEPWPVSGTYKVRATAEVNYGTEQRYTHGLVEVF